MLLKHCKNSFFCNLTVDTNRKKKLDLSLFLLYIEKLLGKDLANTEIEERFLEYEAVITAYNNRNTSVSTSENSKLRKMKEKRKVIVNRKVKAMWMFNLIESKIVFLFLDFMYFILILTLLQMELIRAFT